MFRFRSYLDFWADIEHISFHKEISFHGERVT